MSVYYTDNKTRVRDGYIRPGTRGHARALETRLEDPICRRKCVASDRTCTRVRPRNLHGKEGVDGSSPSEGFGESPAKGPVVLPAMARFRFFAGTRRVHFGTGGHSRARATSRDTVWNVLERQDRDHSLEKLLQISNRRCLRWRDVDLLLSLGGGQRTRHHAELATSPPAGGGAYAEVTPRRRRGRGGRSGRGC